MVNCSPKGVILAGAFFAFCATDALAQPATIQLVGNFSGITCEPDDPANNMEPLGDHVWRKLKFVDEPGAPDTIFFKFTENGSYLPQHWGWSGIWGIAAFEWNPPNIAAILAESGFYYFFFNDSDNTYWLDRPTGAIAGDLTTDLHNGVPAGTEVTLFDSQSHVIDTYSSFIDSTFSFDSLAPATYSIVAHAPGFRDTLLTGIDLGDSEQKWVPIQLTSIVAVLIQDVLCERVDGGVMLSWCVSCSGVSCFDVYRGAGPDLAAMEKRTPTPLASRGAFVYFDPIEAADADWYYYIVESGPDPARFGPLFVKGTPSAAAGLGQNYPNPFNPSTTIPYIVGAAEANLSITLAFYDVTGRLVESHAIGARQPGSYTFRWNPAASREGELPSGVYYCRMIVGKETYTRKLVLLR